MSKDKYFTDYHSPNIVLVPAKSSLDDPPQIPQKPESEKTDSAFTDDTNKSIPILLQGTTSNPCTDLNSNANMNATNKSWASNYLQGIGLSYEKSIMKRRGKMSTSQDNPSFITSEPPSGAVGPHQYANVNAQTAALNMNYYFDQSKSILGNNTPFTNCNNIASNTGVMPTTLYSSSYENNNYYYGQTMNPVESGCCSTCYGTVENLQNSYLHTYGQPSNVVNNISSMGTCYGPNATTTLPSAVNLPYPQTINHFGQPVNITNNNKSTTITPCEDNRCPTPLFDEHLLTPQLDTFTNANSSVTKITDVVKPYKMDDKKLSSVSDSAIEEKTCNCMCSNRNPDSLNKQNTEIQVNTDKIIKQMSSVQANEKAFRDFLRKLKIERPSEKENEVKVKKLLKSSPNFKNVKKSKTKSKERSSVQENEKTFRRLLQKLNMECKPETKNSENNQVIIKNTSPKDTTSSKKKTMTPSENKSSKDSKQTEEERPKFIKTKYVDEQEPDYKPTKKARLDNNFELEKYSKTKIITTKYIDEQEPDYKHLKKSRLDGHGNKRNFTTKSKSTKCLDDQESECKPNKKAKNGNDSEQKKYSNTKTIPTKYVDKQEPEYKPVKKQKNEKNYELKKYSNTKTISTKYVDDKKHEYKQIKKTRINSSSELTKYDSTNFQTKMSRDESDPSNNFCKKYDGDYKIRTYKTESTKYYKYRTENCKDTYKQTPVKSVVKISKTRELKKSPLYDIIDREDLRDKLRRKLSTNNKERKEETFKRKSSEELNDNLIITVNNNISESNISPVKITDNLKNKTESCKKINLVINIAYKQPGSRSESDDKSNSNSPPANVDLSFLDDFNVDEIVASLNKIDNSNTHQNALSEASNVKIDTSNVLVKTENLEINKAKTILEKGVILNNQLTRETNLLDNLRTKNDEIQREERSCMDNESNKSFPEGQSELPQKYYKCEADSLLKTDIKNETVFNQIESEPNNQNFSPEESINKSPSTNTFLSSFSISTEQLNKIDDTIDLSEPINYSLLTKETKIWIENNMNSYDHDISSFDEEDKRRQSELLKILEDTEEDKSQVIQTKTNSTNQIAHVKDKPKDISSYDGITSFDEENKKKQLELCKILEETKADIIEVNQTKNNGTPQTAYDLDDFSNYINMYDDDITPFNGGDKRRQSEPLRIIESTRVDEKEVIQTQTKCMSQTAQVLNKTSNDMNSYDDEITSCDKEYIIGQSELLKILEDTKEDKAVVIQTQINSMSQTAQVSGKISNNLNSYDDNFISFDEEDKRIQSELKKILEGTKEGEKEKNKTQTNSTYMTQTTHVTDKVLNVLSIIDLTSDNSNDSSNIKQSKESSLDDVYIVEEKSGKNLIETIDLTTTENFSNHISTESLGTAEVFNNKESVSYYPSVKENILFDKQNDNNKGVGKRVILSNKSIQGNIRRSSKVKTGTVTKIVTAIRDAIDALKTSETLNNAVVKLNEDPLIDCYTIKDKIDIADVEDKEVSNTQDSIEPSKSVIQLNDESISLSMEDASKASKTIMKDCKNIQEVETSANVTNSENISNCDAEEEKHENEKDHINCNAIMKSPRNINTPNDIICDIANNTKIEETNGEVNAKNEKRSTDIEFENSVTKTSINDCNTVHTTNNDAYQTISDYIASFSKQLEIEMDVPQITESKTEVNIDEKKNTVEECESPIAKIQNKSEESTPKTMPSTSGLKKNSISPTTNKNKANLNTVENANKMSPAVWKNKQKPILAEKLEREMLRCFNQKYTAQSRIRAGAFSKVYHFSTFSRQYAVKSYNDWESIYNYAEKKDMLFSMQAGHTRHTYGCVFLLNSFSLQGHLCLLMDYYPKNLKQALEENEGPFHINAVQHLARQLVSAVMMLKGHDVVHLDIKPTHILLSHNNDRLKLCGLDTACYIDRIPINPNLGTVNYRPPEVIIGYKLGFDVDVWATAAVMYEMTTARKLFPGVHNNDILFKQMCALGPLPIEMLHRSHFSHAHFTGSSFKRTVRVNNQIKMNIITKFYKSSRIETTIFQAYNENWSASASPQVMQKIVSFTALLREMLEVDPGDRMPIQFVNSHPFITDESDVHL